MRGYGKGQAPAFVHLHVHSAYSLLRGVCRPEDLVARAAEEGMPALALTDWGNLYAAVRFYRAAKEAGIRPLLGVQLPLLEGSGNHRAPRQDPPAIVLLAESETGYRRLLQLVSRAHDRVEEPAIPWEEAAERPEGLLLLTGGREGPVDRALAGGDPDAARRWMARFVEHFGAERVFVELQDDGSPRSAFGHYRLAALAREFGAAPVATADVHYLSPGDARLAEVVRAVRLGETLGRSPERAGEVRYFASSEEMARRFAHLPEALSRTVEVSERCRVELSLGRLLLPSFDVPPGMTAEEWLRQLCERGVEERFGVPVGRWGREYRERLEKELDIIARMGFADYFLIVWDFMRFSHERGIATGPGRGSAAGSLVAYLLRITDVDPVRHGLLFERFLNPERVSMPDIDIDFEYERRWEVIDYVSRRYGRDRVAQIITFGTMAAKAAIRDAGRVMGLPPSLIDRVAKMIPNALGITLDQALAEQPALAQQYERDERVRTLIDAARGIEGLPRHTSTHAAGVVIAPSALTDYVPVQRAADGGVVTQYDMASLEAVGLLKMDFLGLRTLSIIERTRELASRRLGRPAVIDENFRDAETYALLSRGDTDGCFQLESAGVKQVLRELKPNQFEDLVAVISLYRPGPMEQIEEFIRAKHGQSPVHYPHEDLRPILEDTYGIIVYQEQIMQIASRMAGFTLGQADVLRRAVGKKKREVLLEQRDAFVSGCVARGYDETLAREVYDLIVRFADYGFNRSHAVAYAVLSWRTAYLKAHYPAEFLASLLTAAMTSTDKVAQYVEDACRRGIEVLPPSIQESEGEFIVTSDGAIRFALGAVKHVGVAAVQAILEAREKGPFRSLEDFLARVDHRACHRRTVEALIRAGAFDGFGQSRRWLLNRLDHLGGAASGVQLGLFDEAAPAPAEDLPDDEGEKIRDEKELMGVTFTGARVYIRLPKGSGRRELANLRDVLARHPGTWTVRLYEPDRRQVRELDGRWRVRGSPELVREVEALLGPGSIVYHLT